MPVRLSLCLPKKKHPQYCAEALGVALRSIPTEGKNMEDLEVAVKKVCAQHGVKVARDSSKKEKGDGGRLVMVSWKCVHGMRNRQGDQRGKSPGESLQRTNATTGQCLWATKNVSVPQTEDDLDNLIRTYHDLDDAQQIL